MRTKLFGETNPMWKGDKVGYISLHEWIRNRKPKPKFCEECKKNKPYDLANISGEYKRDINDFEWLCRKCHMNKDGRDKLLPNRNRGKPMSKKTKKKISNTHKIKGIRLPNLKGIPKPEEQKRKMSIARKEWWKKHKESILE